MSCDDLNIEIFFQENLGYLSKVSYIFDQDLRHSPTAILMYFSKIVVMLRVVEEDDSVELISISLDLANTLDSIDVSKNILWKDSININLRWVWCLTNQQGYTDGIQFEWGDPSSEKSTMIQAIAAASCFRLYKIDEVDLDIKA
jgi:Family of unknown function (DUF6334)